MPRRKRDTGVSRIPQGKRDVTLRSVFKRRDGTLVETEEIITRTVYRSRSGLEQVKVGSTYRPVTDNMVTVTTSEMVEMSVDDLIKALREETVE